MNYSWIAVILSVFATLPQIYKTVSTGSVKDHSEWTPVIAFVSNIFIALHGYIRKDYGLVFFGLWFMMYNSVLIYYKQLAPLLTKDLA